LPFRYFLMGAAVFNMAIPEPVLTWIPRNCSTVLPGRYGAAGIAFWKACDQSACTMIHCKQQTICVSDKYWHKAFYSFRRLTSLASRLWTLSALGTLSTELLRRCELSHDDRNRQTLVISFCSVVAKLRPSLMVGQKQKKNKKMFLFLLKRGLHQPYRSTKT